MDAMSSKLNPDRQKKFDRGSKSLSGLPDALILNILSLLPTEEAIRTSVLSKRWEHLWMSLPHFEFDGPLLKRDLLGSAVDRALFLRGPASIESFLLSFPVLRDSHRVYAWISAIVKRNVQELSISLQNIEAPFSLPYSLFTSATLVVLYLDMPCVFKVPRTVCFSSLKCLSLQSVVFSDDYLTQQLFSGFPVLEELTLTDCNWMNIKFVSIVAPKLWLFIIIEGGMNAAIASASSDGCQMMVSADNLQKFIYRGKFLNECCISNSSTLNEAEIIEFGCFRKRRHIVDRLYKLLSGISTVKHLTITWHILEDILKGAPELLAQLPVFNDLITLEFDGCVDIGSKAILSMLHKCPSLQTLIFLQEMQAASNVAEDDGVSKTLHPCFSHLKEIKVYEFYGDEDHIHALKTMLKNATVLKKMTITWGSEDDVLVSKTDVNRQLFDIPRASESCELVIIS